MNGVLKETEDEAHNKKWWIGACCRWSRPLIPPLSHLLVSAHPGLFNNDKI